MDADLVLVDLRIVYTNHLSFCSRAIRMMHGVTSYGTAL